jgi:putative ABC transport system ATP-binding protein
MELMESSQPLLRLEGVNKLYDEGHVRALCDVSLSVMPGECVAITGPSGSGKTTLLHMLSGLDLPTSGTIFFRGQRPDSPSAWTHIRARYMGFVFQDFHLLPMLTALENVQVPMLGVVRGVSNRVKRAKALLERVGLGARMHHRANALSGGERQRVAVARSLANTPILLLADEPTGNLDSHNAAGLLDVLDTLGRDERLTRIMVTHEQAVAHRAERIVQVRDGRILSSFVAGEERACIH